MLRGIKFNKEHYFDFNDNNNLMDILTENTIILCEDDIIKNFLSNEIKDICDGKHKTENGHDYYIEPEDNLNITYGINYLPTTELFIDDKQKIVLTIEAPYILTATSPKDIWFAQRTKYNKISIYPMRVFKGYKEKWDEGVYAVYRYIVSGKYGNYRYANISSEEIGVLSKKEREE